MMGRTREKRGEATLFKICLQASLHADYCDQNQGGTCKELRNVTMGRTYNSGGKKRSHILPEMSSGFSSCCLL
jgi:hypothetical protein